ACFAEEPELRWGRLAPRPARDAVAAQVCTLTRGAWTLWRLIPRFFPYLGPYRGFAFASIALTAVAILIGLAQPWPLAFIVDYVLGKNRPPAVLTQLIGQHDRFTW